MNRVAFINRAEDRHNVKEPLACVTAGRTVFKKDTDRTNSINRQNGFADYQLIYIKKGYGVFGGQRIGAGNAVLFYPNQPQIYEYPSGQTLDVYWLHFGGSEAKRLLQKLSIYGKTVMPLISDEIITDSIRGIIKEGHLQSSSMHERCNAHLLMLLTEFSRCINSHGFDIEQAIEQINDDYSCDISNTQLAKMCSMSVSHFLRKFKEYTGKTPHAYRLEQRLLVAKELLRDGTHTVKQTASAVGFDDQLYFSRFFKKHTGLTPSEYKNIIE